MEGVLILLFLLLIGANAQLFDSAPLKSFFANCHPGTEDMDECIREGINAASYLMPVGAPEYQLPPFDPFYAKEVVHKRSGPLMQYKLKLTNVVESGWRFSTVTRFKSDLANQKVTYDQTFPEKVVSGDYEFEGSFIPLRLNNKGRFNLTLYDYNQTTTVTMRRGERSIDGLPLSVRIVNTGVRDMNIYISNLLRPNTTLSDILGNVINASWRPFFPLLRPAINDMVSSAFTLIFSRAFASFPFEEVFRPI
ncbi:circadian clock-controlled protein daywake-like [Ischnura elegans]|uniref:circadian clock-controlled protein daywake-like n=1 Tax=Ischnura elegans TaxID=197161 RepID=UPI001ED8A805|nr:circadian clock-controlled protein daywake-like [Ischnura elegans]